MNDILYNSYSDSTSTSTATVAIPNIYWSNDVITTGTITTGTYTINTNTDNITIKPATASKTTVAVEEQKFKNPYDKKIKDLLKRAREGDGAYFSNIKEYVPGKVYEFTISRSPNSIFTHTPKCSKQLFCRLSTQSFQRNRTTTVYSLEPESQKSSPIFVSHLLLYSISLP